MEQSSSNTCTSAAASAKWRTAFAIWENVANVHQCHQTAVETTQRSVWVCCLKYWLLKHPACWICAGRTENSRKINIFEWRNKVHAEVCIHVNIYKSIFFLRGKHQNFYAQVVNVWFLGCQTDNIFPLTERKGSLFTLLHKVVAFGT